MSSQWWRDNEDGPADLTTEAPHFFKIIMPQTLQERKLWIPKKFTLKYRVHLSDTAFLTIPNGTKWKVKLTKHDGEVWFENGWCEFASCHALSLGHLLVFRYEGNSQFYVLIFDVTATEIDYPLDDQLQVCWMEDNESDDNSLQIMDTNPRSSHLQAWVSFTRRESKGSAYGVGGNRVGCKSSPLVSLESDCILDDVSFSHDQCPKKDAGVGMSTNRRRLKGKAVVKNQEHKALEIKKELMTTRQN